MKGRKRRKVEEKKEEDKEGKPKEAYEEKRTRVE